jgi:hypothetical protein
MVENLDHCRNLTKAVEQIAERRRAVAFGDGWLARRFHRRWHGLFRLAAMCLAKT